MHGWLEVIIGSFKATKRGCSLAGLILQNMAMEPEGALKCHYCRSAY